MKLAVFVFSNILVRSWTHLPFLGGNRRRNHSRPTDHHGYLEHCHDDDDDVDGVDGDDDDDDDDDDVDGDDDDDGEQ